MKEGEGKEWVWTKRRVHHPFKFISLISFYFSLSKHNVRFYLLVMRFEADHYESANKQVIRGCLGSGFLPGFFSLLYQISPYTVGFFLIM